MRTMYHLPSELPTSRSIVRRFWKVSIASFGSSS
jgi:hypothetical protein